MLGHLQMEFSACIEAYAVILNPIYEKKSILKLGTKLLTQELFDSQILAKAIANNICDHPSSNILICNIVVYRKPQKPLGVATGCRKGSFNLE
jgi:hypothetical protein